jgi:ankyrin repeat protein
LLLGRAASADARDESGATPLYQAASFGRKAVVDLLIGYHADVNAKTKAGKTPLAAAVANGFQDVAKDLREHGAK